MTRERINAVKNSLGATDALLVSSVPNRFYLTGFESSDGYVLVTRDYAYFLIDFRYVEKAREVVKSCEVRLSSRPYDEVRELCAIHGIKNLYIETYSMSVREKECWQGALESLAVSDDSVFDKRLEEMRSIKTEAETELIKKAQELTDKTFDYIVDRIEVGRTEREIMLDMEFYMRSLGSEGVSFDFIVVSGKNSSLPHGVPTDKKIERGDFLTMDFGAVVEGYHSDMTRTVAIGEVSEEQKKVYDTVLRAQLAAIDAVHAGVCCKDIDKVARDIIYGAGYEGCFGHGLGHSVGIEIHENPCFNTRCDKLLDSGTIMTVEPGIYLENKFGVRIEDMVWTTDKGCVILTKSPKELIIL